jgi:predicted acylesterase/phospholipase RssA
MATLVQTIRDGRSGLAAFQGEATACSERPCRAIINHYLALWFGPTEMEKSISHLALALSGGGHRATLFALGALLAVVDRGLNKRVVQIASVSGGSITNAFVAQRCEFRQAEPGELDEFVEDLVHRVVTKGVVETRILLLLVVLPALLIGTVLAVSGAHWLLWTGLSLFLTSLSVLLVGKVVELLLDRRYFRDAAEDFRNAAEAPAETRWARMRSLASREVEHVFCATDLVQGQPLYVSTHEGGMVWRRTTAISAGGILFVTGQKWQAKDLTIAEVVRASASFPGIPPKRLSFGRFSRLRRIEEQRLTFGGRVHETEAPPALRARGVAFLGDGGLWNNLATHVLREDQFLHGQRSSGVMPHILCINASAPLPPSSPVYYHIPGVAALWALIQSAQLLNVNTVQPRLQRMHEAQRRRAVYGTHLDAGEPLDAVADLSPISRNITSKTALIRHRDDIRRFDPAVREWEGDILQEVEKWGRRLDPHSTPTVDEARALAETMAKKLSDRPFGKTAMAGMVDYDSWDRLREYVNKTMGVRKKTPHQRRWGPGS